MTNSVSPGRPAPTRREVLALGLGAFVVAAIPMAARRRASLIKRTLPVMGSFAEVTVVHRDARYAEAAIDAALGELVRVDRTMSRFRADSDIGRANLAAATRPVAITPDTQTVIASALDWARASHGAFDPAIGRVVELWDVVHRREPPPEPRVRKLAARHFHRHVELGTEHGTPVVFFRDPDIHLDLGAIAKGYGVDLAGDALRRWGITQALIDVGGEIIAIGGAPDGNPWRVGIQSPDDDRSLLGEFDLADAAVATSGDYEQFFRFRGIRYHHLMDPEFAAPRRTPEHSITTIAGRCMDADAAATAAYGMSLDDATRLLARQAPGARVLTIA